MAFIPATNVAEVVLRYTQQGQQTVNTLYFLRDEAWTLVAMNTLGEAIRDWYDELLSTIQNQTTRLDTITVTDLTTQTSPSIDITEGLPITGTASGTPLPNNVTLAITFKTQQRGRSFRGRNYSVGMQTSYVSGNGALSTYVEALEASYDELNGDIMGDGSAQHVVLSRYSSNNPRTTGLATPVSSYQANSTLDSQRRRLPGRGE